MKKFRICIFGTSSLGLKLVGTCAFVFLNLSLTFAINALPKSSYLKINTCSGLYEDIMTRERFLGIEGRKLPKLGQEKPKPIKKPIGEEAIYQGRKLGFQVDTEVPIET